jgi:hypothetical protein
MTAKFSGAAAEAILTNMAGNSNWRNYKEVGSEDYTRCLDIVEDLVIPIADGVIKIYLWKGSKIILDLP